MYFQLDDIHVYIIVYNAIHINGTSGLGYDT